jgi:hypothetical protein
VSEVASTGRPTHNSRNRDLIVRVNKIFYPGSSLSIENQTCIQEDQARAELNRVSDLNQLSHLTPQEVDNEEFGADESEQPIYPFDLPLTPSADLSELSRDSDSEVDMPGPGGANNGGGNGGSATQREPRPEKNLPVAGANDTPTTLERTAEAEDVAYFIEQFEDLVTKLHPSLFKAQNLEDLKKAMLSYMDRSMKMRFRLSFKKATSFEDMKEIIYTSYPTARDVGVGMLQGLVRLLEDSNNRNLNRQRQKTALVLARDYKAEAEALTESKKASKVSDFQVFKWFEGAFDILTRDHVRMRMILTGKLEQVDPAGPLPAGVMGEVGAERPNMVRVRKIVDWNEFKDWGWYIDEMISYLIEIQENTLSFTGTNIGTTRTEREVPVILPRAKEVRYELPKPREDYDDLRFEITKIKDAGVMQKKHLEQQNESLRRMVSELEKLKIGGASSQHRSSANNEAESSKGPRMMDSWIWSQDKYGPKHDSKCWFCGGLHLLNDCDEVAQYGKCGMIAKIRG